MFCDKKNADRDGIPMHTFPTEEKSSRHWISVVRLKNTVGLVETTEVRVIFAEIISLLKIITHTEWKRLVVPASKMLRNGRLFLLHSSWNLPVKRSVNSPRILAKGARWRPTRWGIPDRSKTTKQNLGKITANGVGLLEFHFCLNEWQSNSFVDISWF